MTTIVRRPKASIEEVHAATFDALLQGRAEYLSGARAVLGEGLSVPGSEMGAAAALINAALAQIERAVAHQQLIDAYAAMFGPGSEQADADALTTDRALAALASASHHDESLFVQEPAPGA